MNPPEEQTKRRVLDWIGLKKDEVVPASSSAEELIERIKQLQQENAELRARKDLQDLDPAEIEALAAETAVAILKTVHVREAEAKAAANELLETSSKKATAALTSAEKRLSDATVTADKAIADAQKAAQSTIDSAEKKAASLVAEAEAAAKQIRATLDAEGQQIRTEAQQWANQTRAAADAEIAKLKSDAQQWADAVRAAAENQAARIRADITTAMAEAREAQKSIADAHDKLLKAADKQYRLAVAAIENLDGHSTEVKAAEAKAKPAAKKAEAAEAKSKAEPKAAPSK
ncbi:MAG: hypothetical protein RL038_1144 [Actinomycetota bacterium]|jgi:hypothetical protein